MGHINNWEKIGEQIGEGGQGKVFRVLDRKKFHTNTKINNLIINTFSLPKRDKTLNDQDVEIFKKCISEIIKRHDQTNYCALKELHQSKDTRDANLAEERIKREIEAMSKVSHPNILKIIDFDPDGKWFVSKYYPKGPLTNHVDLFIGNFIKALKSFRPLVEGVSLIHKKNLVHRDIKPKNIFVDDENNLIIGDFGIVFFNDDKHTRISHTFENVGTRDYMAPWAQGIRIEEIKPTFDVFSLGKVLWSMISGKPVLPLWYFKKNENDLEKIFPNTSYINLINPLLEKCIVENEKDCLQDAEKLLNEIDKILNVIEIHGDKIDQNLERRCKVCGIGAYKLMVDINNNIGNLKEYGFNERGDHLMKIFTCNYCGNIQLFAKNPGKRIPPAWI
jgi:serine/threonine protein kinase